jgi:hypothetical protein
MQMNLQKLQKTKRIRQLLLQQQQQKEKPQLRPRKYQKQLLRLQMRTQ